MSSAEISIRLGRWYWRSLAWWAHGGENHTFVWSCPGWMRHFIRSLVSSRSLCITLSIVAGSHWCQLRWRGLCTVPTEAQLLCVVTTAMKQLLRASNLLTSALGGGGKWPGRAVGLLPPLACSRLGYKGGGVTVDNLHWNAATCLL